LEKDPQLHRWSKYTHSYEFKIDGLHELLAVSLVLYAQNLGIDLTGDAAGDDMADLLEILQKLLDAVVGVLLAEEHRVVCDGVVDRNSRVLHSSFFTYLSMQQYIIELELDY